MCTKVPPWDSVLVGISTKFVRIETKNIGMCTKSPPWESILVGVNTRQPHPTNAGKGVWEGVDFFSRQTEVLPGRLGSFPEGGSYCRVGLGAGTGGKYSPGMY